MKRTITKQRITRAAMTLLVTMLTAATAWADTAVSLQQDGSEYYVKMPTTGTNTLTLSDASVTTFKVYDDGGKGGGFDNDTQGNYSNNCDGYLTLTAPDGFMLELSGTITTEGTHDYLTVYDGINNTAAKLLDNAHSSSGGVERLIGIGAAVIISTGTSMTIHFKSNESDNYSGLDLTVTLKCAIEGIGDATNGSIKAKVGELFVSSAKPGDVVTLKADPKDDYSLNDISVVDANSNAVAVEWNVWTNTATFTMPNSPVTVNPTFTELTNLTINMPKTGTKTATIPAGVQSFKVYDDGGPGGAYADGSAGNYNDNCRGYLTLTAPEGHLLQLSGNIWAHFNDDLTVYDGDDDKAGVKLKVAGGDTYNNWTAITTIVSTGSSMTLYFYTNTTKNHGGLDLTVTIIDPNGEFAINGIGNVTNGSIAASISGTDVSKAKANDVVTLTATPSAGYTLTELSVKDANNNAVSVDWNVWSNTATFTMPASAVTVTTTFSNDLYINMPATGTKTCAIPEGVQSFKVYDDGGKDGRYSESCDGTLTLTAPEGYQLQLSGSMDTNELLTHLFVFDGTDDKATRLLNYEGGSRQITTVTSSGRSMTIFFHGYRSYSMYNGLDLTVNVLKPLELANYADNTTAINNNNGMMSKVTLSDRTLLKNGDWNTLCLPFSLTAEQIAASPLAGATIKELLSTSDLDSEGKLTLKFLDATAITAGKPYMVKWDNTPALTISSAADWETFASNVNGGTESYEGKVVKLNADISVSTMVGTVTSGDAPENAFKGIFDGGGHTITVNINSTDRHATAPFRYIKDATIMDVRTAGTVTGTMHCAGLVGFSEGTSYIKNCEVNVAVNCSGSSHSHCGGILGHGKSSTTTVSDCLFSGSISDATTAVGIIYGWGDNSTHTIVNCLAAGTYTGCSGVDLLKKDKGTEVITNCYKTENVGSQGTYTTATGDDLVASLGDGWVNNGGSVVPKMGAGYVPANLTNPVFKNVTIDNTVNDVIFAGGSFKGTYAPLEITDANRDEVLLLATGNKLGYAKTDRTVDNGKALGTCRAYFEITGAAVRSFIMDFGENVTSIIEVGADSSLFTLHSSLNEGWYTLDGRRLQGKPAQKGVYIQNGKKVIIK